MNILDITNLSDDAAGAALCKNGAVQSGEGVAIISSFDLSKEVGYRFLCARSVHDLVNEASRHATSRQAIAALRALEQGHTEARIVELQELVHATD